MAKKNKQKCPINPKKKQERRKRITKTNSWKDGNKYIIQIIMLNVRVKFSDYIFIRQNAITTLYKRFTLNMKKEMTSKKMKKYIPCNDTNLSISEMK